MRGKSAIGFIPYRHGRLSQQQIHLVRKHENIRRAQTEINKKGIGPNRCLVYFE